MGHCVGGGSYDGATVYSLRGPDDMPRCIIEHDPEERVVEQVKGRGNKEVVPRHHAAVRAFVEHLSPKRVNDAPTFGHVFLKRATWPKPRLVSLRDFGRMKEPTIDGNLDISRCPSLVFLPDGLTVGGNLYLDGCASLVSLPDELEVEGCLNISGSASLASLPERLAVGGSLYLYRTSFVSLPEGLIVRGNPGLEGCTSLSSLPEGLIVEGDLDLTGCTSLVSLPDGLKVGGRIFGWSSMEQDWFNGT